MINKMRQAVLSLKRILLILSIPFPDMSEPGAIATGSRDLT
jgi:hypothetical protein